MDKYVLLQDGISFSAQTGDVNVMHVLWLYINILSGYSARLQF